MLLLSLLLAASPTADANAAGMKLYQAKKYAEAVEQFRKAVKAGEPAGASVKEAVQLTRVRALAHFNLACTLALLRKAGKVCEFDAYRGTITSEVQEAIQLDPNRLEKALTDGDLTGIRDTLAFQSWKGLSPTREADLPKLLVATSWWSEGVGVFGSTAQLAFTDRSVTITSLVLDAEGVPLPKRQSVTGTWTLSGRALRLTFPTAPSGRQKVIEATFTEDGRLDVKEGTDFDDAPSECEA